MAEGTATAGNKLKVFVSYSRRDVDFADQLVHVLADRGFEVVIDRKDIDAAERWKERLGQLILQSDIVVFVLSPDSARSDICAWEVEEAARRAKRIIPVLCRALEGELPPARLRDLNYIYFYRQEDVPGSGFGSGLVRLTNALSLEGRELQIERVRVARRIPKRQNIDGAAVLIDGVNDPKLGSAAHPEQVPAIGCPGQRKIAPSERCLCKAHVKNAVETLDLLNRKFLVIRAQIRGKVVDFALRDRIDANPETHDLPFGSAVNTHKPIPKRLTIVVDALAGLDARFSSLQGLQQILTLRFRQNGKFFHGGHRRHGGTARFFRRDLAVHGGILRDFDGQANAVL